MCRAYAYDICFNRSRYDGRMEECGSTYTMQAICFHQGQSARVGHYFAALRDAGDAEKWWEVSDAWVSSLRNDDFVFDK